LQKLQFAAGDFNHKMSSAAANISAVQDPRDTLFQTHRYDEVHQVAATNKAQQLMMAIN
jgi:hypothetical protein